MELYLKKLKNICPQDIEILGWHPAGSGLPHLRTLSFPIGLVKNKSTFIIGSVEAN